MNPPTDQSSREQEREALLALAERIEQASGGPLYIDHVAAASIRAVLSGSAESGEARLLQDENSGREGRRYNEWHASRPDARLNAREAAASIHIPPTAITAEEAGREGEGWISVQDRVPEVGQEVLVYGQSPWEKAPSIKVDLWDEIHEAPVSFSSATVCVGEGWTENESDDITHWQPLPSAPAQSGGQGK